MLRASIEEAEKRQSVSGFNSVRGSAKAEGRNKTIMAMLSDKLRSGQNFYSAQKARDTNTPIPSEAGAAENKKRLHPLNLVGLNKVNMNTIPVAVAAAPSEIYADRASNPPSPRTLMEL